MGNSSSSSILASTLTDNWPQIATSLVLATGFCYLAFYRNGRGGKTSGSSTSSLSTTSDSLLVGGKKPPAEYASTTLATPWASAEALVKAGVCTNSSSGRVIGAKEVLKELHHMWTVERNVSFKESSSGTGGGGDEDYLRSLFALTTTTLPSPVYSRRSSELWGQFGFQGEDPVTDLRGGGTLALRQYTVFCAVSKLLKDAAAASGSSSIEAPAAATIEDSNGVMAEARKVVHILQHQTNSTPPQLSLLQILDVVIAEEVGKIPALVSRVPSSHPKPIPAATTASPTAKGGLHDGIVLFNSREHKGGGSSWYLEACVSIQFTLQVLQDAVRKVYPAIVSQQVEEEMQDNNNNSAYSSITTVPNAAAAVPSSSSSSPASPVGPLPKKRSLLRKVLPQQQQQQQSPPSGIDDAAGLQASSISSLASSSSNATMKLPNPASPADVVLSAEMLRFLFSSFGVDGVSEAEGEAPSSSTLTVNVAVLHYLMFCTMHALWVRQRPHVMEYQTFMQATFATRGPQIISKALWIWQQRARSHEGQK